MSAPKDKRGRDGILPALLKGMATTAKSVMRPTHTAEYPHAEPTLPPRSRGVIALLDARLIEGLVGRAGATQVGHVQRTTHAPVVGGAETFVVLGTFKQG